MEFKLKRLSKDAIPAALERARTYRLLNEASLAESICRDIIEIDPQNQDALVELLLAVTDQFHLGKPKHVGEANSIVQQLSDPYQKGYYSGVILERRAMAHFETRTPGCGEIAYQWLSEAMQFFEDAEHARSGGNDESILRWNTCARTIMDNPEIRPSEEPSESEVPVFDT